MTPGQRISKTAHAFIERGDPTGWFEQVYTDANGDPGNISWADLRPHPHLVAWLAAALDRLRGARTLVVGCGLGDDAEYLSAQGLRVTAFDIAPSAVEWCKRRFPQTSVEYVTANAITPPPAWRGAFGLVVEIYTLQTLVQPLRAQAAASLADCVAPGGTLLVVARGRDSEQQISGPPWPLTKAEFDEFQQYGLREASFADTDAVDGRHFVAAYTR